MIYDIKKSQLCQSGILIYLILEKGINFVDPFGRALAQAKP
jgi:hypothetical protein